MLILGIKESESITISNPDGSDVIITRFGEDKLGFECERNIGVNRTHIHYQKSRDAKPLVEKLTQYLVNNGVDKELINISSILTVNNYIQFEIIKPDSDHDNSLIPAYSALYRVHIDKIMGLKK